MRFLLKFLPIISIILFFSVIYFGGKHLGAFIDANQEHAKKGLVTENSRYNQDKGKYGEYDSSDEIDYSDINIDDDNSDEFNYMSDDVDDNDDPDFREDYEKEIIADSPEASLDAELEGKSSNQLMASAAGSIGQLKDKVTSGTKKLKERVTRKTNKKPSKKKTITKAKKTAKKKTKTKDILTAKGLIPSSYGSVDGSEFLVIAGSFKSIENANIYIDELEKKGLKDIKIISMKEKNLNRVCVSKHGSYEEAKKSIKNLKKTHQLDAYVHIERN